MQKRALGYLMICLIMIGAFSIYATAQDDPQDNEDSGDNVEENDLELDSENEIEEEIEDDFEDELEDEAGEEEEDEFSDEDDFDEEEELDEEEDATADLEEIESEFSDQELELDGGTNPDSSLWAVDKFFDRFADPLEVRAERIAEIEAMIETGKIEDARKALEDYEERAKDLEKNVAPEDREKARKTAAAIHKSLKRIRSKLSESDQDEFFNDIEKSERSIVTAVEIASKIKDLCTELAKLDPGQFHKTCKTENDSPKWQKDLFDDLTEEQKKEAEQFIEVISECFDDPINCKCEESTSIEAFVTRCKVISEAEAKCREGDDTACDIADEVGEDIIGSLADAPHLQNALESIEKRFDDFEGERFDQHIPPECREEGITGRENDARERCQNIMIRENSPEECIDALDEGRIEITNEREFRKACEEIMFQENAPEECIEAGLRDHKECGKFMFQQNAPQECLDAGITGEKRNDPKKCEELMRKFEGEFDDEKNRGPNKGPGKGFNFDCGKIQNNDERLKCFDGAIRGFEDKREDFGESRSFDERFKETKEREKQCAESCSQKGGAWDFSNGRCECRVPEEREFREDREEFRSPEEFRDFRPPESGQFPSQEQFPPGEQPQNEFQQPQQEPQQSPPSQESSGQDESSSIGSESSGGGESSGGDSGGGGSGFESSGSGDSSGITGSIIFDNEFFDYYYR
ncbi:hypothetical protein J4462_00255 [Candidatus Pacearchaeota archaeon]|nr:hypothetical protein [Candidatus Pacearchaeota archaeon]